MSPSGRWLGNPVAVLHTNLAGSPTTVLVQLSSPHYDPINHTLTFHVCTPRFKCFTDLCWW